MLTRYPAATRECPPVKEAVMRQVIVVRVGAMLAVLAVGMLVGRSVLAEDGSADAVVKRSAGAQEGVTILAEGITHSTSSTTLVLMQSTTVTIPAGHTD